MIEVEWWDYDDADERVEAVAGDIRFLIESSLEARGDAVVALSAEDRALAVLDRLKAEKLRWKHVTIVPTDDRLLSVEDPRSAARRLAERFLPLGARVVPLTGGDLAVAEAGRAADARLQALHWPLDLVWLEVAADGHVAAILPGADLDHALTAPHRAVGLVPGDGGAARVTLTRASILAARSLLLSLDGDQERAVLEQALKEGAGSRHAVGRVLADSAQAIDVHWSA